ncbi:MAG TPA: thioesterase domain-containing protein [Abditibacterium sp.]|jgi:pimeloyl-ACP methyl ester carboxylesterase
MRRFQSFVFWALWLVVWSVAPVGAQQLESFEKAEEVPVARLNARMERVFGASAPAKFTRPVILLKIRYRSRDERDKPVTLSGLLALPAGGAPRGLVMWHHGTFVERALAPSQLKFGARPNENEAAILAFASGGTAVAMPDYLGYGAHTGVHPYPLAEENSRSALDFLAPCRAVAAKLKIPLASPVRLCGYSEGAAVAMWTARRLQERGQKPAASALMAGPYDLAGVTRQSLLLPTQDTPTFIARLYLLAFTAYSWSKSRGDKLTDFFRPAMASAISSSFDAARSSGLRDQDIVTQLAVTSFFMNARGSMKPLLTPQFYALLSNPNARGPIMTALRRNDAYHWTPQSPILLWTLDSDTLVVPQNTRLALREFRRRGVTSRLVRAQIAHSRLNHITALAPSLLIARRFFDRGFAGVPNAR